MKKLQVIRSTKEQTKYIESKHALSKKKTFKNYNIS